MRDAKRVLALVALVGFIAASEHSASSIRQLLDTVDETELQELVIVAIERNITNTLSLDTDVSRTQLKVSAVPIGALKATLL